MYVTRAASKQTTLNFQRIDNMVKKKVEQNAGNSKEGKSGESPEKVGTSSPVAEASKEKIPQERRSSKTMTIEDKLDFILEKMEKIDKLDIIESKLMSMDTKIEELSAKYTDQQQSLEFTQSEVDDVKEKIKTSETTLHDQAKELEDISQMITVLNHARINMNEEMIRKEDYDKRDCLLFEGIPEKQAENCTKLIEDLIKEQLKIGDTIRFHRCHRLGKDNPKKTRPIIAKFVWFQDKQAILQNAKNLKGSSVFIQEFFSPTTSHRRNALYPLLRYQKKNKKKCSLNRDQLIIEGKRYTIHTAIEVPNCQEAVTRHNGKA